MKQILILIGIFLIVGCATGAKIKPARTPSGKLGAAVTCKHSEDCYQAAHRICKGPYTIVDKNEKMHIDVDKGDGYGSSRTTYLIECSQSLDGLDY